MPNTYDLHGKNAIVTGGAKGIGRAIAELLITNGCHVLIWDASPSDVSGATFTQLACNLPHGLPLHRH
jgi:NAD(P)-dependent dehydrogenase (short-subunit alcohol dehydrogenase family)